MHLYNYINIYTCIYIYIYLSAKFYFLISCPEIVVSGKHHIATLVQAAGEMLREGGVCWIQGSQHPAL